MRMRMPVENRDDTEAEGGGRLAMGGAFPGPGIGPLRKGRSVYFFGAVFPVSGRTTSHAPPESMRTTHSEASVHFVTCFFFPV